MMHVAYDSQHERLSDVVSEPFWGVQCISICQFE